jgi:hypothetical protein
LLVKRCGVIVVCSLIFLRGKRWIGSTPERNYSMPIVDDNIKVRCEKMRYEM